MSLDLDEMIALMSAALFDHGCAASDQDKRRLAVKDARLLWEEIQNTKLYEKMKP